MRFRASDELSPLALHDERRRGGAGGAGTRWHSMARDDRPGGGNTARRWHRAGSASAVGNIGALHAAWASRAADRPAHRRRCAEWRRSSRRVRFHMRERLFGLYGEGVRYLPSTAGSACATCSRALCTVALPAPAQQTLAALCKPVAPSPCTTQYLYGRNAFSAWRHQRRTRALMARTDAVVAISHHTAATQPHLRWNAASVIHNGAAVSSTPRQPLPAGRLPTRGPSMFHLSRMSPSKNPQAIVGLAHGWPEMTFVLCGPPSDDAKKLRGTVRLPNVRSTLGINAARRPGLRDCAASCPSLTEGFGCRRSRRCISAIRLCCRG